MRPRLLHRNGKRIGADASSKCELVAAGSFFSLGILRRGAGGGAAETEEATVHHGVDVLVRGGVQVAIASSAPPHE